MAQVGTTDVNKSFNKHNRAWRTTIETPFGVDLATYLASVTLINHREIILVDPDTGEKFRTEAKYQLSRSYADIENADVPLVDQGGALVTLPPAATENDLGVYEKGDGTYSVRINGAILFAAVAYLADVIGINASENPENVAP